MAESLAEQHRIEDDTYRTQSAVQGPSFLEVHDQRGAALLPTSSEKSRTSKVGHDSFVWITTVPSLPKGQYLDSTRQQKTVNVNIGGGYVYEIS